MATAQGGGNYRAANHGNSDLSDPDPFGLLKSGISRTLRLPKSGQHKRFRNALTFSSQVGDDYHTAKHRNSDLSIRRFLVLVFHFVFWLRSVQSGNHNADSF